MSAQRLSGELSLLNPYLIEDLGRYGNSRDGGYVLPRSILATIDAVLSCGLSTDWSLEEALADDHPERVIHVYDHTVGARIFRRSLKSAFWKFVIAAVRLPRSRFE